MKNRKKYLFLTLAMSLLLTLFTFPTTAFAQESNSGENQSGVEVSHLLPTPEIVDENGGTVFPLTFREVTNSTELETALSDGIDAICLGADFEIDRAFYVNKNTIVYSNQNVTLTRSAEYVGDVFVVGQDSNDNFSENKVVFSLGGYGENSESVITIDGNSQNMTANVVGTVVFVTPDAQADLYKNVAITNCKKTGNVRALNSIYGLSNTKYVGGAVAILSKDALMNVYGGSYFNNSVNTSGESVYGGAFYNFATLNVYGGLYQANSAVRAGAFYNYRTMNIYNATILDNTSSTAGGAIYLPASTAAKLYVGGENDYAESSVTFSGNVASTYGGAIYSSGKIVAQDTDFAQNSAKNGGAIYSSGSYISTNANNCSFNNNSATVDGGAIFVNGHNTLEVENDLILTNTTITGNTADGVGGAINIVDGAFMSVENVAFSENVSNSTGGAINIADGAFMSIENVAFSENVSTSTGGAINVTASTANVVNATFTKNQASSGSIAVLEGGSVYGEELNFTENSAKNYGAGLYVTGSTVELNDGTFKGNQANTGGAIYLNSSAIVTLNRIDALNNVATSNGGAIYNTGATLNAYNSTFSGNQASAGSAMYLYTSAVSNIYGCKFTNNACYESTTGNAGTIMLYTGEVNSILHSCTFTQNTSYGYGGALLISGKSNVSLYNITATQNTASKGGFMYETTSGTKVTLSGLTLSQNTASTGGPIIWGNTANAKLFINKQTCVDLDVDGELDSTYWASAIANKLTVTEIKDDIPSYVDYSGEIIDGNWDAFTVKDFEELELAINSKKPTIKIIDDIVFEKTLYVTSDTTIFSTTNCKLTRASDFTGSFFVVGKDDKNATLNIGLSTSTTNGLIVIDGENKEAESAIIVSENSQMNLYKSVTIKNCVSENGAVLTVESNATANIYSSEITNNIANLNGVILNNGVLNLENAVITNNVAENGGAIYNVGTLNVTESTINENNAINGGAIYNLGNVVINGGYTENNVATESGGAIYVMQGNITVNSTISNNTAINGGALYLASEDAKATVTSATFENNKADFGGALYLNNGEFDVSGANFVSNKAQNGGAIYSNCSVVKSISANARDNQASQNGGFIYAYNSTAKLTNNSITDSSAYLGGAIYAESSIVKSTNDVLGNGYAVEGGAIYGFDAEITVENSTFTDNVADYRGGALAVDSSSLYIAKSNIKYNSSYNEGGAISTKNSNLTVYDTSFENNIANMNGGAIAVTESSNAKVYTSRFTSNYAKKNGGGFYVTDENTIATIQLCEFVYQEAVRYGGVIYARNEASAYFYQTTATSSKALRGGFVYLCDEETAVTVNDITVSKNQATNGTFAYGTKGSTLYINKQNFNDTLVDNIDSSYWNTAIYGVMSVKTIYNEAPEFTEEGNESAGNLEGSFEVSSADELEQAILQGQKQIKIIKDFEIDRTYYITSSVTIFSTAKHVLTRAANFGGDFFVVGESKDGTNTMLHSADDMLTIGNPESKTAGLLTIDGNRDNMSVDVYGTIFFVTNGAIVNLYDNLSVINCNKVGNERTMLEKYVISAPNRVGGPVAIVYFGALNVYGGEYSNNTTKMEDTSTEEGRNSTNGGVIYSKSNVNVYGGVFKNNTGARGGIIYNYGNMNIYGGSFLSNYATVSGGVYYSPSYSTCQLNVGYKATTTILFKDNVAAAHGGVLCSSTLNGIVFYGNVLFENNQSLTGSGGVIYATGMVTVKNSTFKGNTSKSRGGAMFISKSTQNYVTRYVLIENCKFIENHSDNGGAVSAYCSDSTFEEGSIIDIVNCEFYGNTASSGGAISVERKSKLTVKNSIFENNQAENEAGAMYVVGNSTVNVSTCEMISNVALSHGGAISVRSSTLNIKNSLIENNTTSKNAGAIYIAYSSDLDRNAKVTITESTLSGNTSSSSGGAIYATRRNIEKDTKVLTLKSVDFIENNAKSNGGAILLTAGVDVTMTDVSFLSNFVRTTSDSTGGAIFINASNLTIDGGLFTMNNSKQTGGAISVSESSNLVLNDITASRNTARTNGGFIYSIGTVTIYNSTISNNSSNMGGGVYLYEGAITNIYNTEFSRNKTSENGAGIFIYTYGTPTVINGCTFNKNVAEGVGGAAYVSGKSVAYLYDITANDNKATSGGFIYETAADTELTLVKVTVSKNSANKGPIIWGNTTNAKLKIDKSKFTDLDYGTIDDAYWALAINGSLTVEEITGKVPSIPKFNSTVEKAETKPVKTPVSVEDVFSLSENSSDGYINSTYDKFPVLDNSSNFMSKEETLFENINGTTVKVDTYVYENYAEAGNMTVGEALMIFQAMQYKKANPSEEVEIDIASYRFSVQTAVNINRNSRYFGYVRALAHQNYDEFGFVRVSYLLVSAAKMGIKVNVLAHRDAYPVIYSTQLPSTVIEYFESQLNDPCDPDYVEDKVIGDYLSFHYFDWTLSSGGKGGTDMMHTKLCAVSHYLDMNGEVHRNAVWTSSSNLDGIKDAGYNANWKLQTATIISDHEYIYRTSVNYLRLMASLDGQEEIIEFQNIVNVESTRQIDLILAGRGNEIDKDEQLVYIGTENDDVFELYFTPFGGDRLGWSEVYNPYTKYLRELYNSEDYIVFTWNAAEYNGKFSLARQMEQMIIDAFHDNRNPKNKIYANMESFDASTFDDLVVGKDIGFKSINKWPMGSVHNKDLQFSYVKGGQRYYVSLLNSCNLHGGSMYYQSNYALVIKETTCASNSVFSTVAKYSTTGEMVEHTFTEEMRVEATQTEHGYVYKKCSGCNEKEIVSTLHYAGEWIVKKVATPTENGIRYKLCTICNSIVESEETKYEGTMFNPENNTGTDFKDDTIIPVQIAKTPLTIEATIQYNGLDYVRGGVIFGNYSSQNDENAMNLEIFKQGRVRLFYITNNIRTDVIFNTDIRSNDPVHIAVTIDGNIVSLYVNGELKETAQVERRLPIIDKNFVIGGDSRTVDIQTFKGKIYSIAAFSDVRTVEEITADMEYVSENSDGIILSKYFMGDESTSFVGGNFADGVKFNASKVNGIDKLEKPFATIETVISIPTTYANRAGVILGNYVGRDNDTISIEVAAGGKLRLFYISNATRYDYSFTKDIRSDKPVHLAITVDGTTVTLYVNGEFVESIQTTKPLPVITEGFAVGGDYRTNNEQYFKGTMYSLHLFDNVRTQEEIIGDMACVEENSQGLLYSAYYTSDGAENTFKGQSFNENTYGGLPCDLNGTPQTFEAVIKLSPEYDGRGGIIVSNNFKSKPIVSFEVYKQGKLRLYFVNGTQTIDCRFDTDVRSNKPIHVALSVDGTIASLYINGVLTEVKELALPLPESTMGYNIGGDFRPGNSQYFKGMIYSVNLFDHARTQEEIKQDMIFVENESALASVNYINSKHVNSNNLHSDAKIVYISIPTENYDGTAKYVCNKCGKTLGYFTIPYMSNGIIHNNYGDTNSSLGGNSYYKVEDTFVKKPITFELSLQLSKNIKDRAGVILGNYDGRSTERMNLEIYTNGNPRLWYKVDNVSYSYVFKTDIRSENAVHLTFVINGLTCELYLDGVLVETMQLDKEVPHDASNYYVATDGRLGSYIFKGKIYSASIFSDVRTVEEIKQDMIMITSDTDNVLFSKYFVASEIITAKGPLADKSAVFVGDGITSGTNCEGETYWELLQESLGLSSSTGIGVENSCISGANGNGVDALINRYQEIPESDLITIFMGTNDYGYDTPLGSINDSSDVSFYGALNVIIPNLKAKYPNAKIVFITPIHRYGYGINSATGETHTLDTIPNGAGHTLTDYVNAIIEVCEKYSVSVIDLYSNLELDASDEETRLYYMEDGLHPNSAGHRLIADYLNHCLIEIYEESVE